MPWDDPKNQYKRGHYKQIDDRSGFIVRAPFSKREWTGLQIAENDIDPRHPQDYVRGVRDYQAPPNPAPEPSDHFVSTNQITPNDL